MKRKTPPILGHHAPAPRPSFFALFLVATGFSGAFLLALGLGRLIMN